VPTPESGLSELLPRLQRAVELRGPLGIGDSEIRALLTQLILQRNRALAILASRPGEARANRLEAVVLEAAAVEASALAVLS
jgi:hypothetical protein